MDLGVAIFSTDLTIRPDELAREIEERGFESLWFPEHTHMPVDHDPHPSGRDLPDEYRRTHDPFVALAVAASVTERVRLATGICLVAQRDPIVLAKEVASLDVLSAGRVMLGVGYGWNEPEAAHHRVNWGARREILREKVLALKALWTHDEASSSGEHVRFAPSWSWPKPLQDPHPPILLGAGAGPTTFRHVIEFCDSWMPVGRTAVKDHLPTLRQEAERSGRDPDSIGITVYGTRPDLESLTELADLGVDRVVLWLPPEGRDVVLPTLDKYTQLLDVTVG